MSAGPELTSPTVRLSFNPATPVQTSLGKPAPTVRLSFGNRSQEQHALTERRYPALLVAFPYLDQFLKNRHRYHYRDWALDSGAFSAANSGRVIRLAEYIAMCRDLMATDPTLTDIFALDVIGDHQTSAKNAAAMWEAGIPAIPTFHFREPESALLDMAARYPKIALGGVALKRDTLKIAWAEQVFARVWPKRIHGFGFGGERTVLALPFHSVDASSWELGACRFGRWKTFGRLDVRGSRQDLRGEVNAYMDLEVRARLKWAKQMQEVEATGPDVRLAYSRCSAGPTDKFANYSASIDRDAPTVRLAVVNGVLGRRGNVISE